MSSEIRLRSEWLSLLESEFDQPYMSQLSAFLRAEKAAGKTIYPPGGQFFAALEATPPEAVKVVVLGQDPLPRSGPGSRPEFFSARSSAHPAIFTEHIP